MVKGGGTLSISVGVATETGRRQRNEDFAGAVVGPSVHGYAAAVADGIGGAPGGREASEILVRHFLTDYYCTSATQSVFQAASKVLEALNGWIFSQSHQDQTLAGMGTTFTGLILRGRSAHVLHVGDSRAYRLTRSRMIRLTKDHSLKQPGMTHVLYRAVGIEPSLRLDYARHSLELHDRFLLCSDGVHNVLDDAKLAMLLNARQAAERAASDIAAAALEAGSTDNVTALVIDVTSVPTVDHLDLLDYVDPLPIKETPRTGDILDGFVIGALLSDGRYSRLFHAIDNMDGMKVVLKFPQPRVVTDKMHKTAFVREAWVASQVNSPHVGKVITAAEGKQTQLYTIMPYYAGETLEQRLTRAPKLAMGEAVRIGINLCMAVAALHRQGIIHRDIKPENIILDPLTLIDLGVARILGQDDDAVAETHPGTASYLAPEIFACQTADSQSDVFAIGVTL